MMQSSNLCHTVHITLITVFILLNIKYNLPLLFSFFSCLFFTVSLSPILLSFFFPPFWPRLMLPFYRGLISLKSKEKKKNLTCWLLKDFSYHINGHIEQVGLVQGPRGGLRGPAKRVPGFVYRRNQMQAKRKWKQSLLKT